VVHGSQITHSAAQQLSSSAAQPGIVRARQSSRSHSLVHHFRCLNLVATYDVEMPELTPGLAAFRIEVNELFIEAFGFLHSPARKSYLRACLIIVASYSSFVAARRVVVVSETNSLVTANPTLERFRDIDLAEAVESEVRFEFGFFVDGISGVLRRFHK